ncbi:MAG TPA: homocysteine S-methyltransferase family protein [Thermoleophilaceae bacterium]|jgi:homocysteine S-methyltransferase
MAFQELPQLRGDRLFITDAGIETVLIFEHGIDLPCFASFPLLADEQNTEVMRAYFDDFFEIARERGVGMLLDTVTWRASRDWGAELGYSPEDLEAVNRRAVAFAQELRAEHDDALIPILISGCVGPRGDAYSPNSVMSPEEAESYHSAQIATLADAGVDFICALTLTNAAEGIGIVRAAQAAGVPSVISYTVETDGRLPSGEGLRDAIEETDAASGSAAAYFMVNCAHPSHFADALDDDGPWLERIRGLRANASRKSHAELDESDGLDRGDPGELAAAYGEVIERLPKLTVIGGCCGTDRRHVGAAAAVCAEAFAGRG